MQQDGRVLGELDPVIAVYSVKVGMRLVDIRPTTLIFTPIPGFKCFDRLGDLPGRQHTVKQFDG